MVQGLGGEFTTIKGDIGARFNRMRMPLLGNIKLGIKIQTGKTNNCKHKDNEDCFYCSRPKDVSYFVVPDSIAQAKDRDGKLLYGDKPTELDIMFPVESIESIFPQSLRMYGMNKALKCIGDGEKCKRWDATKMKWELDVCPAKDCKDFKSDANPKGQCSEKAFLYIILWKINPLGCYRIITSSSNSVVDIKSPLLLTIKPMVGRFSRVPLILKRVEMITPYLNTKTNKRTTSKHYPLKIEAKLTLQQIQMLRLETERILPEISPERVALPTPDDAEVVEVNHETVVVSDAEATVHDKPPAKKPTEAPKAHKGMPSGQMITDRQRGTVFAVLNELKMDTTKRKALLKRYYEIDSLTQMTAKDADNFIGKLKDLAEGVCNLIKKSDGSLFLEYPPE